ncbi:MAG: AAA family ATPase [Planctomycetaceae bacterium]|nr:AAA family ATPase [Planctomycetaceae bacterium]
MSLLSKVTQGLQALPRRVMLYGVHGIGKAQPLTARVLTPQGFVPMGELEVGDRVIGSNGQSCRVLGVFPQGLKDVYRVTFRDGSSTECCDDHLWFTTTFNERKQGLSGAVRTLRDIRESLRYGTHFNHAVPRVRPVEFDANDLPAAAWLLGIYLGDGHTSTSVVITNSEADIHDRIREAVAAEGDQIVLFNEIHLRIVSPDGRGTAFKRALEELGLSGLPSEEKFVPPEYLHGSIAQRLELLRGLIDSDGYVTHPGSVEYTTVSRQLSHDFCFLVRSLGGSAKVVTKQGAYTKGGVKHVCRLAYRIHASLPEEITPVSSAKHLAKWGTPEWHILHTIRSVEPIGRKECQCIRIDALDSLYVTDDFILTHNTTFGAMAPEPVFIQTEDGLANIEAPRFPLAESFDDAMAAVLALYSEAHDFQTVVVDSADWLEQLIWKEVIRRRPTTERGRDVTSIEDYGFAKGYTYALELWREVLDGLSALRNERKMMVILIAHSKIERFENPETDAYDRYSPRLNKHASALIQEWCDEVLFATYKVHTKQTDEGFDKTRTRGIGTGDRILRTTERPAHMAKNRLGLPEEMPLDFRAYAEYLGHGA